MITYTFPNKPRMVEYILSICQPSLIIMHDIFLVSYKSMTSLAIFHPNIGVTLRRETTRPNYLWPYNKWVIILFLAHNSGLSKSRLMLEFCLFDLVCIMYMQFLSANCMIKITLVNPRCGVHPQGGNSPFQNCCF